MECLASKRKLYQDAAPNRGDSVRPRPGLRGLLWGILAVRVKAELGENGMPISLSLGAMSFSPKALTGALPAISINNRA